MRKSLSAAAAGLAATLLVTLVTPSATASTVTAGRAEQAGPRPAHCSEHPQYFAYYRTWRDKYASWPGSETAPENPAVNTQRMDDLPQGVDIAFVFSNYVSPDSQFWTVLKDEYVPHLHARGTKVVRTVGVKVILAAAQGDTPADYEAAADQILATYVDAHGLDGLDVDMEQHLSDQQVDRVAGVFAALGKHLGPRSGTDRPLVYDTNQDGTSPVFARIAPYISSVLVQSYGRDVGGLQATWDTYAPYIDSCQYLIGFSFYEERGRDWGDTTTPFDESRAAQYARWQPTGQTKGGIFSYAVDRDGKTPGDDTITRTDFPWTRALIAVQDDAARATHGRQAHRCRHGHGAQRPGPA